MPSLFSLIQISIDPKQIYGTSLFSIAACSLHLGLEKLYKKSMIVLPNAILKQAEILEYLDNIADDLNPELCSALNQAHKIYEKTQTILRTNELLELFFTVTNVLEIYLTSKIATALSFDMIAHHSFSIDKTMLCALNIASALESAHKLKNKIENTYFRSEDDHFLKLHLKRIDDYMYAQTISPTDTNDLPIAYECSGEDSKLNTAPLAEVMNIS